MYDGMVYLFLRGFTRQETTKAWRERPPSGDSKRVGLGAPRSAQTGVAPAHAPTLQVGSFGPLQGVEMIKLQGILCSAFFRIGLL